MVNATDLVLLQSEYGALVAESIDTDGEIDWHVLMDKLVSVAEWTPQGASHLQELVQNYGAFVLRNAAALAIAAGVEDGDLRL